MSTVYFRATATAAALALLVIDTDYTDPGHQVKASCTAAAHLNAKLSAGPRRDPLSALVVAAATHHTLCGIHTRTAVPHLRLQYPAQHCATCLLQSTGDDAGSYLQGVCSALLLMLLMLLLVQALLHHCSPSPLP
jgi:hypothetical protein